MLRDYQQKAVDKLSAAMREHGSAILTLATGAGKSYIAGHIVRKCHGANLRIWILCHKMTILKQLVDVCSVPCSQIVAGKKTVDSPVIFGMMLTLVNRLDSLPAPDYIIIDESHRVSRSGTYSKILDHCYRYNPKMKLIGLTASPQRTDGEGLKSYYKTLVEGVSMRWLVDNGYLSPVKMYAPEGLVKFVTKNGDYSHEEQEDHSRTIHANIMKWHADKIGHKPCLVACCNIKHCEDMAERYRAEGYTAEAVQGGKKHEKHLTETLKRLESGSLSVCCFCQVISEGVSVDNIQAIVFLRRTKSLIFYLQSIGRGLRYQEGKTLTVLDFVGNCVEFGSPLVERKWSLEDKDKRPATVADVTTLCGRCFGTFDGQPSICPCCGEDLDLQRLANANELTLKELNGQLALLPEDYIGEAMALLKQQDKMRRLNRVRYLVHKDGDTPQTQALATLMKYKKGFVKNILNRQR